MPRIASSDVVVPATLPADARCELADALYDVHRQVFAGVERDAFGRYVVDSTADRTWVLRHRDETGAVVGYMAFHVFERRFDGAPTSVFRVEAGMLRDFRGTNASARFFLGAVLRHVLAHPGHRAFYLGSLVHPSSYAMFDRYCPRVWPRAAAETPRAVLELMDALATEFGLARVDEADPLVRHVGWRTIETEMEREYWRASDRPAARFFVDANPGYDEGHGLLTVLPLTPRTVSDIAAAMARRRLRGPVRVATAVAQRTPAGARALRATILRQLREAPMFGAAAESTLRALAAQSEVQHLPGGRPVFRRGDSSDDIYLLVSGAVYVLAGEAAREEIIDELGSGSIFGEMAMLAGEQRSASIRTATGSVLVRIPRRILLPLLERDPALRTGLRSSFAERRFDDTARHHSWYGALPRRRRLELVRRGRRHELAAGATLDLAPGVTAFVVDGALEFEHEGVSLTTRGAALLGGDRALRIRAVERLELVLLAELDGNGHAPPTRVREAPEDLDPQR